MCKEMTTKCICDRCQKTIEVPSKKIAGIYRPGKYPESWSVINQFTLCEHCTNEYKHMFNNFMNGKNKNKKLPS